MLWSVAELVTALGSNLVKLFHALLASAVRPRFRD